MSGSTPWPMGYRDEAGGPAGIFGGIAANLAFVEATPTPERWRCHELDRHDSQPYDGYEPLTWATFMAMGGEFIERFGYEEAQRFVTAELDSRNDEEALLPFLDLVTNLRLRFGPNGPVALGALLAAELAVTGRGR